MKYKVGDMVQIRQWEDMEKEFGIKRGNIDCRFSFVPEMKIFCGKRLRIINTYKNSSGEIDYTLKTGADWSFSEDMFELVGLSKLIHRRQNVKNRTESKS